MIGVCYFNHGGIPLSDIKQDLKNSSGDYVHSTVKTALSAIPFVGGAASELFSLVIAPPVSKRRDEWLIRIAEGIEEIRAKNPEFDVNSLRDNDVFITVVMHATQTAIRNHQEEKLLALKNAVLNSAVGINIEENIQLMFLNLIDTLTPWHLRILRLFRNPTEWFAENGREVPKISMGAPAHVVEAAFKELHGKRSFYDLIVKELHAQGLLGIDSLHTMMTGSGVMAPRATEFGNQFLSYISDPQETVK